MKGLCLSLTQKKEKFSYISMLRCLQLKCHKMLFLWDDRFGGIPRKQSVTITSRASPDAQIDLKRSMDALALAVAPLYDSLTMEEEGKGGAKRELGEVSTSNPSCSFLSLA
jgi:hypothetical protein